MNIPKSIQLLLHHLESAGFEAFVVGGCVRDSLLQITPADWDICTSASPEEMLSIFSDFSVIPTGLKHGTLTVLSQGIPVEITTYRQDGPYLDKRHPSSVTFSKHLEEDLKRRDFTINAMAYSDRTGVIDLFHGQEHLKRHILCCVGDPVRRFSEDALRILRGMRFAAQFSLTPETKTAAALHRCLDGLKEISGERITAELQKMLTAPHVSRVLTQFPHVLGTLFPHAEEFFTPSPAWSDYVGRISSLPPSFPIRFCSLLYWCKDADDFPTFQEKTIQKLKLDKKTATQIRGLIHGIFSPLPNSRKDTRYYIKDFGLETLQDVLLWNLVQLDISSGNIPAYLKEIQENHLCCSLFDLAISGKDIVHYSPSGPEIGRLLQKALCAVIEEKVPNEKDALIKFLFS